jgi:hypothetical protein
MNTKTKVSSRYFNEILNNDNLHEWISDLFKFRIGVKPIVSFENNNFTLHFKNKDQNIFIIEFTDNGRNNLFNKNPFFIEITNHDFDISGDHILIEKSLVLYGVNYYNWMFRYIKKNILTINYDFISYLIWTLNRVEEYGIKSTDKHDRFKLCNSHLETSELYLRPIIDEWFSFINNLLLSNGFNCKKREFSFSVSHDVDDISRYESVPFITFFPRIFVDIIKRPKELYSYFFNRKSFLEKEHTNTFDWLMEISNKFGIRSKFYFIPLNSSMIYDYRYSYNNFVIKILIKIFEKGHEIGIHYSYNSSVKMRIRKEWIFLKKICDLYKLPEVKGGRMHYLRFDFIETLRQLVEVGQSYDNTITFFETGGFRCGTCIAYEPFDIFKLKTLPISIKPLILMEGSVLSYMGLNIADGSAFDYIKKMIDSCYKAGGEFSLLWHNSVLDTLEKKMLYYDILEYSATLKNSHNKC